MDAWRIGQRSVLVHGDSSDPSCVERATGGTLPPMLVFDPPWDADAACPLGPWRSVLAFTDGRRMRDALALFGPSPAWLFTWDLQACVVSPRGPLQRSKFALWYGDVADYRHSVRRHNAVTYGPPAKRGTQRGRWGTYEYQPPEGIGTHLADLFAAPVARRVDKSAHPHEKPADWVRCLINNCGGGVGGMDVLDPFAGGGTSILACEATGRACFAVERERQWIDRALSRATAAGLEVRPC